MDVVRLGRTVRAIRIRRGWRQHDLGLSAGVSQDVISLLERGHGRRLSLRTLERIASELEADLYLSLRWRGGDVDRLLDEGHAALMGRAADLLREAGWTTSVEVTFAVYADRGAIDVLGWHPPSSTLLVVEVKTELASIEETLRTLDMKARLARRVASERLGWAGRSVARLLILPDNSTARRRVDRHASVLDRAFPVRGRGVRLWLQAPTGPVGLLSFVPVTNPHRGRCGPLGRRRVRGPLIDRAERGLPT